MTMNAKLNKPDGQMNIDKHRLTAHMMLRKQIVRMESRNIYMICLLILVSNREMLRFLYHT